MKTINKEVYGCQYCGKLYLEQTDCSRCERWCKSENEQRKTKKRLESRTEKIVKGLSVLEADSEDDVYDYLGLLGDGNEIIDDENQTTLRLLDYPTKVVIVEAAKKNRYGDSDNEYDCYYHVCSLDYLKDKLGLTEIVK